MSSIVRIILCCLAITLVGCASQQSLHRYQEQHMCKVACQQQFLGCSEVCHDSCPDCCQVAIQRAARGHNHYKEQQCIQGRNVIRELNSYRDPLQCRKTTCECSTDYQVCIQSCTGKIPKRLQVAPAC